MRNHGIDFCLCGGNPDARLVAELHFAGCLPGLAKFRKRYRCPIDQEIHIITPSIR